MTPLVAPVRVNCALVPPMLARLAQLNLTWIKGLTRLGPLPSCATAPCLEGRGAQIPARLDLTARTIAARWNGDDRAK